MNRPTPSPRYRVASPAFQEYPADMLANLDFRMMTLAERGLLYTLRMEAWINGSLPFDYPKLARILNVTDQELDTCMSGSLRKFIECDESGYFHFPDLERYRAEQADRKARQSAGAGMTNTKRKKKLAVVSSAPTDAPSGPPTASRAMR